MTGLVGWWPLHEWSGQANDLSGSGNHGTVNGATQGVWGVGGLTSYSFDGSDDGVTIDGADGHITAPVTVSFWVRKDSTTSGLCAFSHGNTRFQIAYETGIASTTGYDFNIYDGSHTTIGSGVTTIQEWVHLTATFDGSTMEFWVNGDSKGTASSGAIDSGVEGTSIGSRADDKENFDGDISDVRLYNRALSASEIQTLYGWGSNDYTHQSLHDGSDSGAVSRYEFTSWSVTSDSWGSNTLTDNTSAGTTTDAIRGDAKSFDGTDDYMDAGAQIISDDTSKAHTVSGWIRSTASSTMNAFGVQENGNNFEGVAIQALKNPEEIAYFLADSGNNLKRTRHEITHSHGAWMHITGTYDGDPSSGNLPTLYINGAEVSVDNSTSQALNSNLGIDTTFSIGARDPSNPALYFAGDIDDVRIYSRTLSAAEVAQLYRWGAGGRDLRKQVVNAR